MTKIFSLIAFMLASSFSEGANIKILAQVNNEFKIQESNCDITRSCGIKRVFFQNLTKEITVKDEKYYSTDSRMGYETKSALDIEDFVIVQMIRGCVYSKYISKSTGEETQVLDSLREFWGNPNFRFKHPTWVIDNTDPNPYYTSFGDKGIHALLRWNRNPRVIDPNQATYYYNALPPHNTVYATDLPSPSYSYETSLNKVRKISSMELKTCLFHKSFVSSEATIDGSGIEWDKAIKCHDWQNNFNYNEAQKKMEIRTGIDPFCK